MSQTEASIQKKLSAAETKTLSPEELAQAQYEIQRSLESAQADPYSPQGLALTENLVARIISTDPAALPPADKKGKNTIYHQLAKLIVNPEDFYKLATQPGAPIYQANKDGESAIEIFIEQQSQYRQLSLLFSEEPQKKDPFYTSEVGRHQERQTYVDKDVATIYQNKKLQAPFRAMYRNEKYKLAFPQYEKGYLRGYDTSKLVRLRYYDFFQDERNKILGDFVAVFIQTAQQNPQVQTDSLLSFLWSIHKNGSFQRATFDDALRQLPYPKTPECVTYVNNELLPFLLSTSVQDSVSHPLLDFYKVHKEDISLPWESLLSTTGLDQGNTCKLCITFATFYLNEYPPNIKECSQLLKSALAAKFLSLSDIQVLFDENPAIAVDRAPNPFNFRQELLVSFVRRYPTQEGLEQKILSAPSSEELKTVCQTLYAELNGFSFSFGENRANREPLKQAITLIYPEFGNLKSAVTTRPTFLAPPPAHRAEEVASTAPAAPLSAESSGQSSSASLSAAVPQLRKHVRFASNP